MNIQIPAILTPLLVQSTYKYNPIGFEILAEMIPGVRQDDGTPLLHHADGNPMPIAIIGLGCRLPAGATNVENFWAEIANGESGWAPHPANRYDAKKYYHPDPDKKGSFNAKGAHYLEEDIARFDPQFFNVTVAEAIVQLHSSIQPSSRLTVPL